MTDFPSNHCPTCHVATYGWNNAECESCQALRKARDNDPAKMHVCTRRDCGGKAFAVNGLCMSCADADARMAEFRSALAPNAPPSCKTVHYCVACRTFIGGCVGCGREATIVCSNCIASFEHATRQAAEKNAEADALTNTRRMVLNRLSYWRQFGSEPQKTYVTQELEALARSLRLDPK